MQYLPEDEQADQDQAIVEVQLAILGQGPERAGEQEQGDQGEEQIEPVDAREFGMLLLLCGPLGFKHRRAEHGGHAKDESQVGGIVDEAVLEDHTAIVGGFAHDQSKHQIREPGAVGHDECAEYGPFKAFAFHGMQSPDHDSIGCDEDAELDQWLGSMGLDGMDQDSAARRSIGKGVGSESRPDYLRPSIPGQMHRADLVRLAKDFGGKWFSSR